MSNRPQPRGFTLVELLVVVAIIGVLVSILVPSLSAARAEARVTVCLTNLRSQATILQQYTIDANDALPPKIITEVGDGQTDIRLINAILAEYEGHPFEKQSHAGFQLLTPDGVWRCPNVDDDFPDRWSHSGLIHHAPNRWLFGSVNIVYETATTNTWVDVYTGWQGTPAARGWRKIIDVARPTEVVSLIDNASFFNVSHGHRETLEDVGLGCHVMNDPPLADAEGTPQSGCEPRDGGAHAQLAVRPAAFLDGHAESLSSERSYWQSERGKYQSDAENAVLALLYRPEVKHFMWFITPTDYLGPYSGGD